MMYKISGVISSSFEIEINAEDEHDAIDMAIKCAFAGATTTEALSARVTKVEEINALDRRKDTAY
jgi:pyruvate/2-oxoacid:ferredoxin oxidoreductase alpha subunit